MRAVTHLLPNTSENYDTFMVPVMLTAVLNT